MTLTRLNGHLSNNYIIQEIKYETHTRQVERNNQASSC